MKSTSKDSVYRHLMGFNMFPQLFLLGDEKRDRFLKLTYNEKLAVLKVLMDEAKIFSVRLEPDEVVRVDKEMVKFANFITPQVHKYYPDVDLTTELMDKAYEMFKVISSQSVGGRYLGTCEVDDCYFTKFEGCECPFKGEVGRKHFFSLNKLKDDQFIDAKLSEIYICTDINSEDYKRKLFMDILLSKDPMAELRDFGYET